VGGVATRSRFRALAAPRRVKRAAFSEPPAAFSVFRVPMAGICNFGDGLARTPPSGCPSPVAWSLIAIRSAKSHPRFFKADRQSRAKLEAEHAADAVKNPVKRAVAI
jgi:hypothetical protein